MIMSKLIKLLAFVILFSQMFGCEDKVINLLPITTKVVVTPATGLTTSVFQFDLSKSTNSNSGDARIFYRFDWESDGSWDNVFTDQSIRSHRFYKPGIYLIIIEGLDLHGQTDTTSVQITIGQGYSKPHPKFKILPTAGNIMTDFVFDASSTRDDEDSLNTLKFRWDWEGDNTWDTPWLSTCVISHRYPNDGPYYVNLEVLDPSNLRNQRSTLLRVSLQSDSIKPSFITIPAFIIQKEEAIFDATSSVDLNHPGDKLMYRWDWENDGSFDIEWTTDPIARHVYVIEQDYMVKLEVKNSLGLRNSLIRKLEINHKNLPPVAFFKTSSAGGNTKSNIRFDAWGSRDFETIPSKLLMRWDFNADGIFDTEYAMGPEMYHRFAESGQFPVVLEVKDEGGLTDTYSQMVCISASANPTDILLDKRGVNWEYYGIVQVGHQWWFARNLSVYGKKKYQQEAYNNDEENMPLFGYLYPKVVLDTACPTGWRVPSRADWDLLFSQFPADSLFDCLKQGGRSDVNLVYNGMGDGWPFPYVFSGLHNYGFYWSTTRQLEISAKSEWYITIDKNKGRILKGFGGVGTEYMAIRCVKDE